jgi:glutamyl-tRNA reductase
MERFFAGEREDACCKEVMEQTVSRVVNKLLHCVIKNINSIAKNHSVDEAKQLADNIARQAKEIISEDIEKKDRQ